MQDQDFERNLGFLIGDVARLTRTSFDRRVQTLGLTRSQWWVLTYVYREQGLTQSALAEHLEVGKVALGNLIDRLEAKGWVERKSEQRDRRINRIYLTQSVMPIIEAMRAPAQDLYETIVASMSNQQQEALVDLLLMVRRNLSEDVARGKSP